MSTHTLQCSFIFLSLSLSLPVSLYQPSSSIGINSNPGTIGHDLPKWVILSLSLSLFMTIWKHYKIAEAAAVKYVCLCPKATELCVVSSMSTGASTAQGKIDQHEESRAHQTWVGVASKKEKDELKSLKESGTNPGAQQRSIAREAIDQHYLTYCLQNGLIDSKESAWNYVRMRHPTIGQELEALFDFWVWYRFHGSQTTSRNRPFIERAEQSFVYQFIMGEYGRRVCTIKPTNTTSVTHALDGLFLIVQPGRLDDLIKIMRFDIQEESKGNWRYQYGDWRFRYPYQLIESTPKPDDMVYAFAVINDHPCDRKEIEASWEQTLRFFGGEPDTTYNTPEMKKWKLSTRFSVSYKTLQKEIIPLFVYLLDAHAPRADSWKDSVSCAIVPPNYCLSIVNGEVFYKFLGERWVDFDVETFNTLVVVPDEQQQHSHSFITPAKELREMNNKSSFFPFVKNVKKGNKAWCDGGVATWSIDRSSSFIQKKLEPLIRAQQAAWKHINVVGVRRYTRLDNANVEIFLQGLGSECEECHKACHILFEAANKVKSEEVRARERELLLSHPGGKIAPEGPARSERLLWRCRGCDLNTPLQISGREVGVFDDGPFKRLIIQLTSLLISPDVLREKKAAKKAQREAGEREAAEREAAEREAAEREATEKRRRLVKKRKLEREEEDEDEEQPERVELTQEQMNAMS